MKVSSYIKTKNNAGKRYLAKNLREDRILTILSEKNPSKRAANAVCNAEHNWDRANNGAKVWSF